MEGDPSIVRRPPTVSVVHLLFSATNFTGAKSSMNDEKNSLESTCQIPLVDAFFHDFLPQLVGLGATRLLICRVFA